MMKDKEFYKAKKKSLKTLKSAIIGLNGSTDKEDIIKRDHLKKWRKAVKKTSSSIELYVLNAAMIVNLTSNVFELNKAQEQKKELEVREFESGGVVQSGKKISQVIKGEHIINRKSIGFKPFTEGKHIEAEKEKYLRLAKAHIKTKKKLKIAQEKIEKFIGLIKSFNRWDYNKPEFFTEVEKIINS